MHEDNFSLMQDHKETNSIPLESLFPVLHVCSFLIKQYQVIELFSIWLTFGWFPVQNWNFFYNFSSIFEHRMLSVHQEIPND